MLMPSIFGENLFDDWMDFPFHAPDYLGKEESVVWQVHAKNDDEDEMCR